MGNKHLKRKAYSRKGGYAACRRKKMKSNDSGCEKTAVVAQNESFYEGANSSKGNVRTTNNPMDQGMNFAEMVSDQHFDYNVTSNSAGEKKAHAETASIGNNINIELMKSVNASEFVHSDVVHEEVNDINGASANKNTNSHNVEHGIDIHIAGRRIVDLNHLFVKLHENLDNHECPFSNLRIINSIDKGLRTRIHLMCTKCQYNFHIWTDPENQNTTGINESAVCGTITAGTGYSGMQEELAAMSIPFMATDTYLEYRNNLFQDFLEISGNEIQQAAALEREIAIGEGHVINEIPYIEVIADGCWAKRSYASGKHDSLSGAAMIFGAETLLPLFVGVRNKYCAVHARAESLNKGPAPHTCSKNWNETSSSMERSIISKGFQQSVEHNDLIYRTLISDGDSSVYQTIREKNPYARYGVLVEKIECSNHLFRNLSRKLKEASTMKLTNLPSKETSSVTEFRKSQQSLHSSGLKIRKCVEEARDARNAENIEEHEKVTEFYRDIFNTVAHVFGDHEKCKDSPFRCQPKPNDKNMVVELHRTGIYPTVYEAVSYLSSHAKSLLRNVNTNVAESCNAVVNKLNSGKRINHCMRNSYEMRCHGAVVQHSTQLVLSKIHNRLGHQVPVAVQKMEKLRRRRNDFTRLYRLHNQRTKQREHRRVDKDYGPAARKPDVDKEIYDISVDRHMQKLAKYQENSSQIEQDTITQSSSELWHHLRTEIITASKFGPMCKMLPKTSCKHMVAGIRYPKTLDNAATRYGLANENNARRDIELETCKKIIPCGLFIDQEVPYLGASPDGLIDDNGIVEIKCPHSARASDLEQAIAEHPRLRSIFDKKNKDLLNTNHDYYYQVQGQLHVTRREYCIFAIWTPQDLKLITITRDDTFWGTRMCSKLHQFYMECLLPEIVDSRHNRNMPIRDPERIITAQEKGHRKKPTPPTKVDKKSVAQNTTKPPANPQASSEWIVIESDEDIEATNEVVELLEIVRRNISIEEVEANVLPPNSLLIDSSIDLFQNIIQENTNFRCNPASYTAYYTFIKPCDPLQQDLQIIGGNACRHWCCIYHDGKSLYVYDSLLRSEFEGLSKEEKRYIAKRYPHLNTKDIVLQPVTRQPDSYSCGIYAAAFATTIALGADPVRQSYSRNANFMRESFVKILRSRTLITFPCE